MRKEDLPILTFEGVPFGAKETPWNLVPLLYKGGAAVRVNKALDVVDSGVLGPPLRNRIALVVKLHEVIAGNLAGGSSKWSELGGLDTIRRFIRWADEHDVPLSLDYVESAYLKWADHLLHRVRTIKDISETGAYSAATKLGRYLDHALERGKPILFMSSLKKPHMRNPAFRAQADKQNLSDTFSFGAALLDICDGLCLDAFWGPLPVRIPLRTGEVLFEYSMVGRRHWPHQLKDDPTSRKVQEKEKAIRHAAHEADKTLRTRFPLANLRIEAELLIFIGQTGMNLAQAHQLRLDQYSYTSSTDGYQVRSYKHRRSGPVLFEIYGEYREVFERYLAWRKAVFPKDLDGLLFPLIRRTRHLETPPTFDRVRAICKRLNLPYISPQKLRRTRVNWLLRRSRDVDLTAEMDQHTKETLLTVYEEPSLQVASSEVTQFWARYDPTSAAPAPGICVGTDPKSRPDMPAGATAPDCVTPAGCLWCQHQRDIDSFDHAWNLCSYRYLKTRELCTVRPRIQGKKEALLHPAELAINRLTEKLAAFKNSSLVRAQWVEEGLARIEEGHYHSDWSALIEHLA